MRLHAQWLAHVSSPHLKSSDAEIFILLNTTKVCAKIKYMKKIIAIVVLLVLVSVVYFLLPKKVLVNEINEVPQEKINVSEVCEGALIRMTFENGEAAAKFVEDCIAGKHPEVIEQFKADLNLQAGAEI